MSGQKLVVTGLAAVIATALACSKQSSPTSPSASVPVSADAAADGSTLKASAPTLVSPLNDVRVDDTPTLVANAATGTYTPATFSYDFELYDPNSVKVATNVMPTPSYKVPINLDFDKRYTWRVRAALLTSTLKAYGPWSAVGSFLSPNGGYIRGSEVYDPLINGKTVGQIHGPVTFIPGVGVRLDSQSSWIAYPIPTTGGLVDGEFSALVMGFNTVSSIEEPKNSILCMNQDDGSAFNDNQFRMSIDVRGNGAMAFRFLAGQPEYAQSVGAERVAYPFHENLLYFVQGKWQNSSFNATFREGGFNGTTIYDITKGYEGTYRPNPHVAYVGRPFTPGSRDSPSSWDGAIVRQVWLSSGPRPASANK